MLAVAAVLFAILWKQPPAKAPAERSFKPVEPARPPAAAESGPRKGPASAPSSPHGTRPANLTGLLEAYLSGRRLETAPGAREFDLLCRVPEGGSLFKAHAELSTAVRVWGGAIASGEEKTLEKGARVLDLTITRRRESIRLRLLHEKESSAGGADRVRHR